MRRFFLCVLCVLTLTAAAGARQDERQPEGKPTPRAESKQETPKPAASAGSEQPRHPAQLANVRLEVTITDQRASGQPTTKTVALVLADRANGRIRTTGEVRVQRQIPGGGVQESETRIVVLNVDAHPELTRDGRVRAHVTLEYKPVAGEAANEEQALTTISEQFAVILEDGKPLVVSQSADPTTDRRVRVEVKATILK
jgi:hypothetical protein